MKALNTIKGGTRNQTGNQVFMYDHFFAGITSLVSLFTLINTIWMQRRMHRDNAAALERDAIKMAAIADNTAKTNKVLDQTNGLVAIMRSDAHERGVADEQAAQAERDKEK